MNETLTIETIYIYMSSHPFTMDGVLANETIYVILLQWMVALAIETIYVILLQWMVALANETVYMSPLCNGLWH
jgi:hypothetical protein